MCLLLRDPKAFCDGRNFSQNGFPKADFGLAERMNNEDHHNSPRKFDWLFPPPKLKNRGIWGLERPKDTKMLLFHFVLHKPILMMF